jgi:hypothetical protein
VIRRDACDRFGDAGLIRRGKRPASASPRTHCQRAPSQTTPFACIRATLLGDPLRRPVLHIDDQKRSLCVDRVECPIDEEAAAREILGRLGDPREAPHLRIRDQFGDVIEPSLVERLKPHVVYQRHPAMPAMLSPGASPRCNGVPPTAAYLSPTGHSGRGLLLRPCADAEQKPANRCGRRDAPPA